MLSLQYAMLDYFDITLQIDVELFSFYTILILHYVMLHYVDDTLFGVLLFDVVLFKCSIIW